MLLLSSCLVGCGTTRWTDTLRTATEQLVVSHAIDQAVAELDFTILVGQKVFLDPQYLDATTPDRGYIISSVRQHVLASGCLLMEERPKADYVVEVRCGAAGTDRHDQLLLGIPQMSLPSMPTAQPVIPAALPEVPLVKKTNQVSAAKLAVFAYNRTTGEPVLQSGIVQFGSNAKNLWVLGAGPIQSGRSRKKTSFGGTDLRILPGSGHPESQYSDDSLSIAQQRTWSLKPTPTIQTAGHASGSDTSPTKPATPPAPTVPTKGAAVILPPSAAETQKPSP